MTLLNLLAIFTLISGIFTISSKNPVISVISLISTFLSSALYLILIGINFIGISYIIVYCGAIAVLFLFVILMLDIKLSDILETGIEYRKNIPLGIVIVMVFLFIFYTILPNSFNNVPAIYYFLNKITFLNSYIWENFFYPNQMASSLANFSRYNYQLGSWSLTGIEIGNGIGSSDIIFQDIQQIQALGYSLYTYGAVLLILLSIILLLSMYATIIISSNNSNSVDVRNNNFSPTDQGENASLNTAKSPWGLILTTLGLSLLFIFLIETL